MHPVIRILKGLWSKSLTQFQAMSPPAAIPSPAGETAIAQAAQKPAQYAQREAHNPRAQLHKDCESLGYRAALKHGSPYPDANVRKAVESDAASLAETIYRPVNEAIEQQRKERLAQLEQRHQEQQISRDRAAVSLVEAKRERAKLGALEAAPDAPYLLLGFATLGLSLSFAPTLHDLFVGLDAVLRWMAGGLSGLVLGAFIVLGIYPSQK